MSAEAEVTAGTSSPLRHALSTRQLTMIGLGGVIGAGLFVGSGKAISSAGPGVVLVYAATGVVVILVMRMLAELAVANPDTGSFSAYAMRELGPWAGLAIGWIYAYHWCVVVAFEAIAGSAVANTLVPAVPTWLFALAFMAALTGVNLISVRSFGRFEFWFALIKVATIVVFIAVGVLAVIGLIPGVARPGLANLTGHGGLFPAGGQPVLLAALTVFFAYFGTELVTVAAGEARNPTESVRRGMRSVSWRILVFYVGSVLVVVTLLPWNAAKVTESPYAAVLDFIGLPAAGTVMNLIVITAVLSCLNSGLYSASRMLFSLARRGEAPKALGRTGRTGVPATAVLAASTAGFLAVIANYFLPTDAVFTFLLDSSGGIAVIVYLCISVTQIAGRRRLRRTGAALPAIRMWGFPYLSGLVIVVLLVVIGGMAFSSTSRESLALTLVVAAIAVIAGIVYQRARHRAGTSTDQARVGTDTP